ncbi:unnamed protein product [Linum trigynum]|uniref:Uncharacterized protein n=1 Tax=Linum trigynum TaxID=586398 RepID=A0AAV2CU98_9ROSI
MELAREHTKSSSSAVGLFCIGVARAAPTWAGREAVVAAAGKVATVVEQPALHGLVERLLLLLELSLPRLIWRSLEARRSLGDWWLRSTSTPREIGMLAPPLIISVVIGVETPGIADEVQLLMGSSKFPHRLTILYIVMGALTPMATHYLLLSCNWNDPSTIDGRDQLRNNLFQLGLLGGYSMHTPTWCSSRSPSSSPVISMLCHLFEESILL